MACLGILNQSLLILNCYNTQTKHSSSSLSLVSSYPLSPRTSLGFGRFSTSGIVIRAETMATEKLGIKIERNPSESKLTELGVKKWPKWGCPPSKFPWTFTTKETCYLLEGKVKVYPDGSDESVEIGAGDLVEFPKGMSCTWDVSQAVDKHYNLD